MLALVGPRDIRVLPGGSNMSVQGRFATGSSARRRVLAAVVAVGTAGLLSVGLSGAAQAAPARPDLVISAVKWAPVGPVAGQQVRFSAVITNRGNAPTPAGTITGVAFEVDGVKRTWSDDQTGALAAGTSITVTANGGPAGSSTWASTSGTHTLRAVVDDVGRIAESREDNNSRSVKFAVASGLSVRAGGGGALIGLAPLKDPTVLTTTITGDLYAGCVDQSGALVDGSERFVTAWTMGRDRPNYGGKFNDGVVMVPAEVTAMQVGADLTSVRYAYQGRAPIVCPRDQAYRWTTFETSSITATRWPGQFGGDGPALAAVTMPLQTAIWLNTF